MGSPTSKLKLLSYVGVGLTLLVSGQLLRQCARTKVVREDEQEDEGECTGRTQARSDANEAEPRHATDGCRCGACLTEWLESGWKCPGPSESTLAARNPDLDVRIQALEVSAHLPPEVLAPYAAAIAKWLGELHPSVCVKALAVLERLPPVVLAPHAAVIMEQLGHAAIVDGRYEVFKVLAHFPPNPGFAEEAADEPIWEWCCRTRVEIEASPRLPAEAWGVYGEETNSLIEGAYRRGDDYVDICVGAREYRLTFIEDVRVLRSTEWDWPGPRRGSNHYERTGLAQQNGEMPIFATQSDRQRRKRRLVRRRLAPAAEARLLAEGLHGADPALPRAIGCLLEPLWLSYSALDAATQRRVCRALYPMSATGTTSQFRTHCEALWQRALVSGVTLDGAALSGACVLCATSFAETPVMPVLSLPDCQHTFHQACAQPLVDEGSACPCCRRPADWRAA